MWRSLDYALAYVKLFTDQFALLCPTLNSLQTPSASLVPLTQRDKVDEEFSHSSKESLRPLTQRDKVDVEEFRLRFSLR